jgi:L-glyceraldehyde 3-phosphate reductase
MMMYTPSNERYERMTYERCGKSGLKLPRVSLGLWHNFGDQSQEENMKNLVLRAFDLGITHFDLANNYGPPPGSAEEHLGTILKKNLMHYRDELIISTKAGYDMWPGPYGDFGSKKYLISSLDQSLKRLGLEYVDIFYHHRPDPETPLEETMGALDLMVRQGKALYVGISNYYDVDMAKRAIDILKSLGTPCLIHQPKYSMFNRGPEEGLLDMLSKEGVGAIAFSPLANGLLTNRYLGGIPKDSRAGMNNPYLKPEHISDAMLETIKSLNEIAASRGQTLAQMALSWVLRDGKVTSVLIGASKTSQIEDCAGAAQNVTFTKEELQKIDSILNSK